MPTAPKSELPASGILAGLEAEHRAFLSGYGTYRRAADGETLITEGQPQESLYMILSGKVHAVATGANGNPRFLAALEPGESMGEINLFDPGTASATAISRGDSLIWSLSRSELDSLLGDDPVVGVKILRGLLSQMARRIRLMNEKLTTAETKSSLHEFWGSPAK